VLPRPAQYLLRFDDLCPTVCRERWGACRALIEEFELRPVLAIVPDNHDPDLERSAPDASFWEQMRAMEKAGATVALHGYRHLCASRGRSLVPLHRETEFAGVNMQTQHEWIRAGLRILRDHGLDPKMWIAPRHGFDAYTLRALRMEGIKMLSDGFARAPFRRQGLIWIPQQLWAPAHKKAGLWTVCVHPNTAGNEQITELRCFLRSHDARFTSVDRVLEELQPRELAASEQAVAAWRLLRMRLSRFRKNVYGQLRVRKRHQTQSGQGQQSGWISF
jgi:predicted deacetylase